VNVEEYIRNWLTTLVQTDGILITISLAFLTILYTSTAMAAWIRVTIGIVVLLSSVLLMVSTFSALDSHGSLILQVQIVEKEKKDAATERVRKRARRAELAFKAGLVGLVIAILLIVVLPNIEFVLSTLN